MTHDELQWFYIWDRLPSYNDVTQANRTGWQAGAGLKKRVQKAILFAIAKARGDTVDAISNPVNVHLYWHEPNHRRDVDNVQSSQKFILDALQEAGILQNDSPKYVKQVFHTVDYDCSRNGGKGYVGVYLEVLS